MFLVSFTKGKIADSFQSLKVKQFQKKPFFITVATDSFLSKFRKNEKGFSFTETPFDLPDASQEISLVEITFMEDENILEIFKPTISGRPVYYHVNSDGEFFCSTHIKLLREAGVRIQENQKALPEFFIYRLIMPPRTLYKDIGQLLSGSRISVELNNKCQIKPVSQFDPPEPDKENDSLKNISKRTLHLLTESIRVFTPGRERLSIPLSGGLDSSILYQICRKIHGIDETYSTGYPFEDPMNNREREYALSASKALKSKHTYYEFDTKEYLHGLIRAIAAAEEPVHHLQSVMLYLLFGKLPKGGDIVISGEGADSSFGCLKNSRVYRHKSSLFKSAIESLFPWISQITTLGSKQLNKLLEIRSRLGKPLDDPAHIVWSLGCYGVKDWVCNYFGVRDFDIIEGRYSTIKIFENRPIYDQITLVSFLGGASISKSIWNKFGEDQGKILYYPYGDANLLYYIHTVPWSLKLKHPKNILREVAKEIGIPKVIINRPKQSFGISADKWGERGSIFEPLVPLCSKVFDVKEIKKMQSSKTEKAMTFWNMLNYSIWKRLCVNNESVDILLSELNESIQTYR